MADFNPDPQQTPESPALVRNQSKEPPGILPKNAQTWVIAGLATVMVAAIALSGNGSKSKTTAAPRPASLIDPNAQHIAEYRNRLDEETRKLAAEQATLNQAKQAAASTDPRVAAAMQSTGGSVRPVGQQPAPNPELSAKKQLEFERERREYNSLFASNVALTFRKDSPDTEGTQATAQASPRPVTAAYPYLYPVPPNAPPEISGASQGDAPAAGRAPVRTPLAEEHGQAEQQHPPRPDPELSLADGKRYWLLEGTILETVLTNRLNGALAGPVNSCSRPTFTRMIGSTC